MFAELIALRYIEVFKKVRAPGTQRSALSVRSQYGRRPVDEVQAEVVGMRAWRTAAGASICGGCRPRAGGSQLCGAHGGAA